MKQTFKPLPAHIRPYAFDFRWDNRLLWALDVETERMDTAALAWHFTVPWLHTDGARFNLTPHEIMEHPEIYKEQYERTMASDLSYPIDIMENKGRWLILDGLHRLMKAVHNGDSTVTVRKIPHQAISKIEIR